MRRFSAKAKHLFAEIYKRVSLSGCCCVRCILSFTQQAFLHPAKNGDWTTVNPGKNLLFVARAIKLFTFFFGFSLVGAMWGSRKYVHNPFLFLSHVITQGPVLDFFVYLSARKIVSGRSHKPARNNPPPLSGRHVTV